MPMSRKRWSAATASVACSDDSTRWPVSAACTAMRAVSTSRISPTRMASGSWRRIERSPPAKVMPGGLVDLDLVDGREHVLDRILDRHHVDLLAVDLRERGVERGGLARAGGARADDHAVRRARQRLEDRERLARHAEVGEAEQRAPLVEDPEHALLAVDGGGGGDAHVERHAVDLDLELAVLGPAALDDVHLGHDLDAAHERGAHDRRQVEHLVQRAVDAVADAHAVGHRLDVDVGRALARPPGTAAGSRPGRRAPSRRGGRWRRRACPARRCASRASKTRTCSSTFAVVRYATSMARWISPTPPT